MDMIEIMKSRHSVRQYRDKSIEAEKQETLNNLVKQINQENNLHIQIFYDEPKCFNSIKAHYGKFTGVKNYISLVGKKSNVLDETLGYYGEAIVLKAQELGLNTCWVAMNHGKSSAKIQRGEKEVCLIALGYGENEGIPHINKDISKVSNYANGMPDWFLSAVNAALLAPTAMNQQKFFFELTNDGKINSTHGRGFYTKLDFGIVKYHFDTVKDIEQLTK